jgi:glycine/D-amino acid oxidase-like deaminating enzyme
VRADILIAGQGLAGTLLGWELERAGIPFAIADAGHAAAASRVAAGMINPITGRRLVKSWRVDALLPLARESYRTLALALGVPLWREMRVRRRFADDRERRVFADKQAREELAPFAGAADGEGFWIEGAARVDTGTLLAAARARWRAAGVLREERVEWGTVAGRHELVVDCTGAGGAQFDFVPWEFSKGEILTVAVEGLDPGVILNDGHWVLPIAPGVAKVGATHEPGRRDAVPTAAARAVLEARAGTMLRRPLTVSAHVAGVRVALPDRRPVAGRHPADPRLGVLNGLGAKGALVAPWLARQWVHHLTEGVPFEAEVDVARFSHRR